MLWWESFSTCIASQLQLSLVSQFMPVIWYFLYFLFTVLAFNIFTSLVWSFMCISVDNGSKCFLTFATLVWLLSCMNMLVFDKLLLAMIRLLTRITLMPTLFSMFHNHVILQPPRGKKEPTFGTFFLYDRQTYKWLRMKLWRIRHEKRKLTEMKPLRNKFLVKI